MDWFEVDKKIKILASKCTIKPDVIIGLVRGGIVPARLLAKYLGVNGMYCITVAKHGDERLITTWINEKLNDKNILLVEDVLESGASLITAKKYLEGLGAKVKTASIYIQPQTKIIPDYYIAKTKEVPTFPWD